MVKLHEVLKFPEGFKVGEEDADLFETLKGLNLDFGIDADLFAGLRQEALSAGISGNIVIGPFKIPVKFEKDFAIPDQKFHIKYPK
jgi:hypothetical protein